MPRELSTLEADFAARFAELLACKRGIEADVDETVAAILRDVDSRGDAALIDYTWRFDRVRLE